MPKDIDHKDQVKHHNWIKNLRKTSHSNNCRNTKLSKANTSGVKGVCWSKRKNKWRTYICVNSKQTHINSFEDFDAAVLARYEKENELGWHKADKMTPAKQHCIDNNLIVLVKVKRK